MSALPSAPAGSRHQSWSLAIPAAVALVYAAGHLGWYVETPLGQVPVLDERENLALAEAIHRGSLPPEPFYRAPGYALVLAGLRTFGVPSGGLFAAALLLGAVLHAINAALVAAIARTWFGARSALLAGALFALHPVFVHYATQALDATPALTLFLLGLAALAPRLSRQNEAGHGALRFGVVSVAWAAATLLRPNYLLAWITVPVIALLLVRGRTRVRTAAAALAGVSLFAGMAAWQWSVSGVPGFLPWQGAYNLWAANQPGTHGRYYVQRHALPADLAAQNPARAESIHLFRLERGETPTDIATLNAHWRQRFLDHITAHPLAWSTLLARKTYALLNTWEQYNNKTFAFHQARSPWLRWNPIGWGALFVLAVAGAFRLARENPVAARALALVAATLAVGIVLFFVSARFRLPLGALAVVLAGGILGAPAFWRDWPRRRQIALVASMAVAALVSLSSFDNVRDRAPFVQDHALLARAADTVGDDLVAWTESAAALRLRPDHPDALRLAVASYFNLLLDDRAPHGDEPVWRESCRRLLEQPQGDAPDLRAVAALALWRGGQPQAAREEWRRLESAPSAIAARLLVQDLEPGAVHPSFWDERAWRQPLVRLAAVQLGITPPAGAAPENRERATSTVQRLFHVAPRPGKA